MARPFFDRQRKTAGPIWPEGSEKTARLLGPLPPIPFWTTAAKTKRSHGIRHKGQQQAGMWPRAGTMGYRSGSGEPRVAKGSRMRQRIALEAARIMLEEGVSGFQAAKQKAAARMGSRDTRHMPGNVEIEQAMADYQRLFRADSQPGELRRLRQVAVQAMTSLGAFSPRLVGPVLRGVADANATVNLHLFAETPEEVMFELMRESIPFEADERVLRLPGNGRGTFPMYRFLAGEVPVELTVFPITGLRQAPLSPVDGRPMERATIEAVRRILEQEGSECT